jgi:hypothetical protein
MKKRNPAAVLLLPLVTLGIYAIYWLVVTRRELLQRSGQPKAIPSVWLLFLPLLLLIALVAGSFAAQYAGSARIAVTIVLVLTGITGVIGIIGVPLWWFWQYCKVLGQQSGTNPSEHYVFFVVIGYIFSLTPVWMLIVQQNLNRIADHDAGQHHLHPAPPTHTRHQPA